MLDYMALSPGQSIKGLPIDVVFIGSCTNSRIEDLRAAANVARGRHVVSGVRALVVPGSGAVKAQAELEGLDKLFLDAGFEWRDAGCRSEEHTSELQSIMSNSYAGFCLKK